MPLYKDTGISVKTKCSECENTDVCAKHEVVGPGNYVFFCSGCLNEILSQDYNVEKF